MQAASRAGRWRPAGGYVPVFWKHGYADTSVQELERATGVTKSGLYAEFAGKEAPEPQPRARRLPIQRD